MELATALLRCTPLCALWRTCLPKGIAMHTCLVHLSKHHFCLPEEVFQDAGKLTLGLS